MIEKVSYEDMQSYSKELSVSTKTISDLIENKDFPELQNFINEVNNYSNFLNQSVELYKSADEAISELKRQRTSN